MSKQFVFLDDSGDTGLKNSATSNFIIAAVLVVDRENLNNLTTALNNFRTDLGWNEFDELKFSSTRKSVIKNLLSFIHQFEFSAYAVIIDKTKIVGTPQYSSEETLHSYAIKELLLRLELSEPEIVIDGVAHKKQAERVRTYLRKSLRQRGIEKCKINFVDSRKDVMIQLADIVAGSIARSLDKNKKDHSDYLELLGTKIKVIHKLYP